MKHGESVQVEMLVPNDRMVDDRLEGFYQALGWTTAFAEGDLLISAQPPVECDDPPQIIYRRVENRDYVSEFVWNMYDRPSSYAVGFRLPKMYFMISVGLLLPSSTDVQKVWNEGGDLLQQHAHVPVEIAHGRRRFYFTDPFNYSFQVISSHRDLGAAHTVPHQPAP